MPLSNTDEPEKPWPFSTVLRTRRPQLVNDLASRIGGTIPGGAWPEPARNAVVLLLLGAWDRRPLGFMVLGINPRRQFDTQYETFATQVTDGMAAAIASAHGHDRERSALRARLDKIASVEVDQSIAGRLLNYGNVSIVGMGEVPPQVIQTIASPLAFRSAITAH